jgi:stalled ribosome alternative rescue factor ArfA
MPATLPWKDGRETSSRRENEMTRKNETVTGKAPARRNAMAGSLANGAFRHQVVRARKGKGSYSRKPKHNARAFG